MKLGLWLLPAFAIGTVGTILAASLPRPPSLPDVQNWSEPARPAPIAAAPAPPTAAIAPAPTIRAVTLPKDVTGAVASAAAKGLARRPTRRLAKAGPDHHPRAVVHPAQPRYGTLVPAPPIPYPGMPMRAPTQIAMAPPPYGVPAPYWRGPYAPY